MYCFFVVYLAVNHDKQSPVFSTAFSADGSTVFSGGADNAVRMWQLGGNLPAGNIPQQIGAHDQPVKAVGFIKSSNLIVSAGWDAKLKFWDTRNQQPVGTIDLPERAYAMDVRDNLLVVGTAGRNIISYDVSGQPREHSRKESPLKFQTRTIACFPDQTGFAVGSIEGRVGIHYVQKVQGKDSFAFKCHRQDVCRLASLRTRVLSDASGRLPNVRISLLATLYRVMSMRSMPFASTISLVPLLPAVRTESSTFGTKTTSNV